MNRYFVKKVALDFGRTFLGFYAVTVAGVLASSLANVEAGKVDLASWKPVAAAAAIGAGSAFIRALQAKFTNWETDSANR